MSIKKWVLWALVVAIVAFGGMACRTSCQKELCRIELSSPTVWIDGTHLHISYNDVTDESSAFQMERLITEARKIGITTLQLHLNNGGGSGIIMYDIIDTLERLKKTGLHIITHARGHIASAAVPLFLVGDNRITYENTMFMIHPCGGWNNYALEPCQRILVAEITMRYCRIVEEKTLMDYMWCWNIMAPEDLDKNSNTNQYWFNSFEALLMGFATELK